VRARTAVLGSLLVHAILGVALGVTRPARLWIAADREPLEARLAPPAEEVVHREEDLPEELPPVDLVEPTPKPPPEPPLVEPPLPDPGLPPPEPVLEEPSDTSPRPDPFEAPPPGVLRRTRPQPPPEARPEPGPSPPVRRSELRALHTPAPPYPAGTLAPGTVAELLLEYTIGAGGEILDARVRSSSGYPALDSSVVEFVRRTWRYHPPGSDRRVVRRFVFRPPA
jgi:protein TonB